MNTTQFLLSFTDKIEQKEFVSQTTAIKLRRYVRSLEDSTPIELFMIVSGIMGALFCAAGIFTLIGHNWDEFPKYIRGTFSVAPVVVGLWFYYRALFHHSKSRTWIEASSVFLMLMIGASIALVSQTYQLDGDFNKFIKVWALLTIPLFYFARASGISLLYLGLITALSASVSTGMFGIPRIGENENNWWYWVLLLAFLPHYLLALKKDSREQSIRIVYMSYALYLTFMIALLLTIKGNYILWIAAANVAFYVFGKRFMGNNSSLLARPFQFLSQFWIVLLLISLSNKDSLRLLFKTDSFINLFKAEQDTNIFQYMTPDVDPNEGKMYYFLLVLLVLAALYFIYFYFRKHFKEVSYLMLFVPAFLLFTMFAHEYILAHWMVVMLVNAYILLLAFNAMVTGSENQNIVQMVAAFLLISVLLWLRYFDTDWNFIMKGLMFVGIGGVFFLINLTVKGKVERIERNKTRRDDY